jgi:phosphoglucosamine mutase
MAHDGDADRALLCDETGALIDGDDIHGHRSRLDRTRAPDTLAERTVVATVMSNAGLDVAIKSAGGKNDSRRRGRPGTSLAKCCAVDLNFGGEQSGHLILRNFSTTGDGLVAALQILRIMKAKNQPLSKLAKCWMRFPQLVTNVRVREKKPFEQLDGLLKLISEAESELKAQGGRVFLRYSGTEPKARLLLESRDAGSLKKWSQKICAVIQKQIGA